LRASDGARLWSNETRLPEYAQSTLIATPDAVYLATQDEVRAYRASDGKSLWTHTNPDYPRVLPPQVVVGGSTAYLPNVGGFAAVRTSDGSTICAANNNLEVHALALAGNTLFIAAQRPGPVSDSHSRVINPEAVHAYDATTCTQLWRYATASNNSARALIAGDDTVYVNADDGIHALRAADGKVLWQRAQVNFPRLAAGWTFAAQPTVLGDTLFVTSALLYGSGSLFSFEADGLMHIFAIAPDGSNYWHTPVGHVVTFGPR
jgi:outer membrane protein assembly factor BamB